MDKPLARDKDDQDRDAHLKAIERAEDPMLQYMRKKQKKAISGLPRKLFTHHYTKHRDAKWLVLFRDQLDSGCAISGHSIIM